MIALHTRPNQTFTKEELKGEEEGTMVFPSPPLYLDPPNWHQHPNPAGADHDQSSLILHQVSPMAVGGEGSSVGTDMGFVRPPSMAERARLAKLPQPDMALNCPRCDSNNTKFCYYNNYSLTQPRHFCKTCRRYWTQGGALRNVPVGGGCRRNKRSRSGRSKSPAAAVGSSAAAGPSSSCDVMNNLPPPQPPLIPFQMPPPQSLNRITDFDGGGLNFGGLQPPPVAAMASSSGAAHLEEQWRMQQQFPFMVPASSGLYRQGCGEPNYIGSKPPFASAAVKQEEANAIDHSNLWLGFGSSSSSSHYLAANNLVDAGGSGEQYRWMSGNPWGGGGVLPCFATSSSSSSSAATHLF